ncbi:fibronectin type III domain-containing [Chlorella sorokiniana]|uniref:Fibronectin type III domain-containing n=1 Tax=Chlorella sorokiniana TaxID=3076 RepID=A0A2P6TE78_CHLSO|nr:fibronectin type III domain-containing [Chlorella sorokiniana]|eukprot:PRW20946.1 fibronectin type III domain-containing [Chlorella sorokiniana]
MWGEGSWIYLTESAFKLNSVPEGEKVRGNNSRTGADGKSNSSAFAFPYPYTAAAKLWFKVTVVVGGTRSAASAIYGPIVVGTPATPRITSALGGASGATLSFTAVPSAVKYIVTTSKDGTPLNVTDATQQAFTLAQLGGEPGEFTFSVVAENANGALSEAATTGKLVVGSPGAPAWAATNPIVASIGTARLSWTVPAYNAKIGTRYYVQLWRDNGATKFGGLVALESTQTGEGTVAAPFTATINITASTTDQDTIIYRAQLYDATNTPAVKLGDLVVLNVTDGSGTDADPYVASLGPFAQPVRITVAIQASGGAGGSTTALSAQSNAAVVGLPLVPQIQGLDGSKTELRLTWLKNDTTATAYKIAVFKAGTLVSPVVDVLSSSLTGAGTAASPFSFAIPAANLPEANRYAVKVAGVNANGAGPWSALSEVALYGVPTAPGAPAVTLVDPSVRVVFTKSDTTATKHSAFLKPTSGAEVEVPLAVKAVTGSNTQLFAMVAPDASELPQGGTYTLQVAAYNANDDLGSRSAASAAFQLGTVAPSAPRAVMPTAPNPLAAVVTFQAPASTGGSPITSYEVELFLDDDSTGVKQFQASTLFVAGQTEGSAARPFRITFNNLAPGPWTFVVTAVNKNGRAAAPVTAAITVKTTPPTRPAIASITGADSDDSSGTITQTISLSVLKPAMGGAVTGWTFSLRNSAKNFAFISNRAFTPSDGDGTSTDPYTATLTIPGIPDGVYTVTVAATTATGTNTSVYSPPVVLGTPPTPSVVGVTGSRTAITLSVRVPQAVTVPANAAAGIRTGTTTASQPSIFTVTLMPTLGTCLRALTRRVRAQSGNGANATPYVVVVPVTAPNEYTVQAATGSNVNGASDADDYPTPVAAGIPGTATGLAVVANNRMANVSFASAPWWTATDTVARVKVINCVTGVDETSQATGGVLPPTTDPENVPFLVRGSGVNQWRAHLRSAGNNSPTRTNPVPRAGCWRFELALINVAGGEAAMSAQTTNIDVGIPHQVGAPTIAQNAANGYRVRIFSGPANSNTLVRTVGYTPDQARTVQNIVMPTTGTNSVAVRAVGANGASADSPRSSFIALVARRRTTAGRRLTGSGQEEHLSEGSPVEAGAASQPKRRSRHLL